MLDNQTVTANFSHNFNKTSVQNKIKIKNKNYKFNKNIIYNN